MMISVLLAAALTFSPEDAHEAYQLASHLVEECTPRVAGTIRGKIASNWILDHGSALGIDMRRDIFTAATPQGPRQFTNLSAVCPAVGSDEWVVLLSHYDTKALSGCPGANDGASTTGLLMALAAKLDSAREDRANVLAIWTDGEECLNAYAANDGLWGAKRAAETLKEKGLKVRAVICLDMLGDKDLDIIVPSNGDERLGKIAVCLAERLGYKDLVKLSSASVKDDHVPFAEAGFRTLDLIDFNYGSKALQNDYWHTEADTMDKVSEESLLKSGTLVAEFIKVLK